MNTVVRLELHLLMKQSVYFQGNADDQSLITVVQQDTKLTNWVKVNIADLC